MCVYVCVSAPQAMEKHSREVTNQTSPIAFQFVYMALAIDSITDGCGLSNKECHNHLTGCTLLTRRSASVLKVGMTCGF